MPTLVDGFNQWRNQYRDKMEYFSFFAVGNGGCGIANVTNEMELYEIISARPMTPFSDMQVEVLVDGDEALRSLAETVKTRAAQIA